MAISKVTSGGIADGTLSVEDIADDAVTAAKLANSINTDIATGVTGNTTANAALPKAGGTMTGTIAGFTSTGIDDNADATAITIDASENVGIGTTSPNNPLHINGGAADTALQITNNATGTAATDGFSITVENPTAAVAIRNREATEMKFLTSNTERMRIDSSGRVTMPYQPAFKAAWSIRSSTGADRILSTNNSDTVTTGRDEFNTGSHFSAATGRFTAPVAGTYLLGFQGMRHGSNGASLECRIQKNGGFIWARAYRSAFNNSHEYWSIVTNTKCAAGDYFEVLIGANTSIYNDDTYFYGHLIG